MSWDDFLNPHEQAEYECYECGADMQEDKHNHIIDPCRYATYSILSRPNFGKYALH